MMAATFRSDGGLHHAASLGNIDASSSSQAKFNLNSRNYDSEDETMGRLKSRQQQGPYNIKPSVYSKEDIIDQYCLTDRQLNNSIEPERRDRFFGCWSTRSQQSFLGVCVGRRAPSDENLQDYAPINRQQRLQKPYNDDDLEGSYFRRKPTSFLSSNDAKRYTWMAPEDEAVRAEGPRLLGGMQNGGGGPYIVGSYPPKSSFLSQSTDQITGYRCPAHINLSTTNSHQQQSMEPPRTKHVSFARSLTLASFDDAIGSRPGNRMINARSQERLIGGKKPTITITQQPPHQMQSIALVQMPTTILQKPQLHQTLSQPHPMQQYQYIQQQQQQQQQHIPYETHSLEKQKRNVMKTQATQTEAGLERKTNAPQMLSLSPKTVHRVRMVSQGAQTNGINGNKKLTKSYSEMVGTSVDASCQYEDEKGYYEHDPLFRTQSEDSPKSPRDMSYVKPSSGFMMTTAEIHTSRTPSRQSQLEGLTSRSDTMSTDNFFIDSYHNNSQDSCNTTSISKASFDQFNSTHNDNNLMISRRASHTLQNEPIFIGRNELEQMRLNRNIVTNPSSSSSQQVDYETHSLPRRTCIHHIEDYHSHSLPRREHHHHYLHERTTDVRQLSNGDTNKNQQPRRMSISHDVTTPYHHHQQPSYVNVVPDSLSSRRSSAASQSQQVPQLINSNQIQQQQQQQGIPPQDEMCSTCSSSTGSESSCESGEEDEEDQSGSETEKVVDDDDDNEIDDENEDYDEDEEKEIFIDFKPISPSPSQTMTSSTGMQTMKKKKKLIKAMSEGEILIEENKCKKVPMISASEEDLTSPLEEYSSKNLEYTDSPIRDEDICKTENLLNVVPETTTKSTSSHRYKREAFRKRSVSLEDPLADEDEMVQKSTTKSKSSLGSPSPPEGKSSFASSEDITRDHSDGLWNESQATVLPQPPSPPDFSPSHLTPTTQRKHRLHHQQRSSLDIDAIDVEDMADQPLPPLPPSVASSNSNTLKSSNELLIPSQPSSTNKPAMTPTGIVKPTPSIAVTHTKSIEREEKSSKHRTKPLSPSKRRDIKKHLQQLKSKHAANIDRTQRSNESLESTVKTSKIIADVSEGSTTEDYATCTDNSKRTSSMTTNHPQVQASTGMRKSSNARGNNLLSPILTGTGQQKNSQTITIEGSSFESASSFHSLPRVDAICEDEKDKTKVSPSHSVCSTSSGSYCMPPMKVSSPRHTLPKPVNCKKNKKNSMSDDCEKVMSSSHDEREYKREQRVRRSRDWSEEERRRKKGNFKLDVDKESMMKTSTSLTSSLNRQTGVTANNKKLSPEDKNMTSNTVDSSSPSKHQKRFRPKTRKIRNRTPVAGDDPKIPSTSASSTHKIKNKSPEKPIIKPISTSKLAPAQQHFHKSCMLSPKKIPPAQQRLKAISTESLRSLSPGSDSVFYSEADIGDHQIHCHHCGKEVEVVTAVADGSEESVVIIDDGPDIVQPPEGFADSPNGITKVPPALKYYKRYRAEDRSRHKKTNGRAKSEERGADDVMKGKMRGAGSTPSIVPAGPFAHEHLGSDPEQGVYHGNYNIGIWMSINDPDVWRKTEPSQPPEVRFADTHHNERRGSTESEKDFRKKFQAITHRMVHRKSCLEMYRRQATNTFEVDKRVIVQRVSGEFGFRIHGSKPVVVSAIEKNTPAETSGLELGDIVLSVNGVTVLDKSHSEVVKIAHAGSDTLELEVARTIHAFTPVVTSDTPRNQQILYSGYLWRKSGLQNEVRWIRRWFSVQADQCLYFYKSESENFQPLGVILLTNHKVSHSSIEKSGRPFAFTIEFNSNESRTIHLACDTEESANRWISIMSHSAEQNDSWLESNMRHLKLPPSSIVRSDCSGYLMKLGIRWRSWTKRYCVLRDACLFFFYDANSQNAIGMACLQGYRVQPFATGGKKHAFELVPPDAKYRNYYFHTETEMDKKRWLAALEYSIDRWMRAN